jgi:hypothetical protein
MTNGRPDRERVRADRGGQPLESAERGAAPGSGRVGFRFGVEGGSGRVEGEDDAVPGDASARQERRYAALGAVALDDTRPSTMSTGASDPCTRRMPF